jgi:hypothetical protein
MEAGRSTGFSFALQKFLEASRPQVAFFCIAANALLLRYTP